MGGLTPLPAPALCVIGLPNRPGERPREEVLGALARHRVFCGSERHRRLVAPWLPPVHRWEKLHGTVGVLALALEAAEPVAVLASGDPLFFGIAGALRAAAPDLRLEVLPWFNSLQLLCHRIGLAYEQMVAVSVHGRGWQALDTALIADAARIGVLTDTEHTPAAIAARLIEYGFSHYLLHVGEALESPQERVRGLTAEQAALLEFDGLNCVVLERLRPRPRRFGIPEAEFAGLPGRPDMITKMPVRLTSLARLDLPARHCLWDIGSCTGSLAVEARLAFPHLSIVAFERRPEGTALLRENARRFGAPGLAAPEGDFFACDLAKLPPPDAVFIGGHGGRLAEMLQRLDAVLAAGGRIVLNAVQESSVVSFMAATAALGYACLPPVRLQVDDHNPITVLGATKPGGAAGR